MSKLLALDTTTHQLQLSLVDTTINPWIDRWQFNDTGSSHAAHSTLLLPTLQQGLDTTGWTMNNLTHIAFNVGPGSFTGIRTGLITVKMLCQWLPITAYAFTPFELLASHPNHLGQPVRILLNAFRGQVHQAELCISPTYEVTWIAQPAILPVANIEQNEPNDTITLFDDSLTSTLGHLTNHHSPISSLNAFMPSLMLPFIQHHPDSYEHHWTTLTPNYAQQPHITLKQPIPKRL